MAQTVGSHSVATFTAPSNGDALDATVVKGNDNTLRSAYVSHDSDPGIHVQSSTLAARPTAGTEGRKWITTDSGAVKLWYDDGSNWNEVNYLPSPIAQNFVAGANNTYDLGTSSIKWKDGYFAGTVNAGTLSGSLNASNLTGTAAAINGSNITNLTSGNLVGALPAISGANLTAVPASVLTGTTLASNVTASSLTSVGTLTSLTSASVTANNGQILAARSTTSSATGSTTVSFSLANHRRLTLVGNVTITLSGGQTGGVYTLELLQDATGSRGVTWSNVVWANGATPTGTSTASRKDIFTFFYDGSNYCGVVFGLNFSSTG